MSKHSRRDFLRTACLQTAALSGIATANWLFPSAARAQAPGERPERGDAVQVLNPRGRVPVSLIIDDSTCLVNLAHFGMPQFAQTFPERKDYQKPWKSWSREIPDSFVRKFGEWCAEQGVKGKYSIVPYPACVGWLDRYMPGWSERELRESVKLVRDLMTPNWDIHPEMVSHTRVIDTKTGRPYPDCSEKFMENWGWTDGKSVDELADYMSYALRILKNVDLACEGITTPGGFGNCVLAELAQATFQSCRDVYGTEIPHYFRHLFTDDQSVAPRVEYAAGLDGPNPECVVSIIGCTGDWFGGWDGDTPGDADRFITSDLSQGRMVDVIGRGEPAIMVCHWPGIYFNGREHGFQVLQEVVQRLHRRFDHLIWMKLGEISRYWAAKELTRITVGPDKVELNAPFAAPQYTVQVPWTSAAAVYVASGNSKQVLRLVGRISDLEAGTWCRTGGNATFCFDLEKGRSEIRTRSA
ncbi:MAG: hypothetical protein GXX96_13665 [Planctomycetaceae bacterium]|nr:hypothetical protein [Planctomycetaceae bacterium]